jgi:hypothetical protein
MPQIYAGVIVLHLELKQEQFNTAMGLYATKPIFKSFTKLISTLNIALQIYLLFLISRIAIAATWQMIAFFTAFILADFLNGLVHMYMDNNDEYDSLAGPLIANFHMHHKTPMYKANPLLLVYFNEAGSKIWLVVYLLIISLIIGMFQPSSFIAHLLVYVGILSCVAEVSHYLCHSSTSSLALFLGRFGMLLPKRHHAQHHLKDNTNYAFLNGISDPLINLIARRFYAGYKDTTDLHFANYTGQGSDNR